MARKLRPFSAKAAPKPKKPTPRDRRLARAVEQQSRDASDLALIEGARVADHAAESRRRARPAPEPRTEAQAAYDRLISTCDLVFGLGSAGTGKTWWAVHRAVEALKAGETEQIILCRPLVQNGAEIGILPGDLEEKMEPFFAPLVDAINDVAGVRQVENWKRFGKLIIKPLELIRGATLGHCWLIGDEMQNATASQIEMLLTRFGEDAKFLLNGDPDQCDLPGGAISGLADAVRLLKGHGAIGIAEFGPADVVRSGLCGDIVRAYAARRSALRAERVTRTRYNEEQQRDESDDAGLHRMLGAQA